MRKWINGWSKENTNNYNKMNNSVKKIKEGINKQIKDEWKEWMNDGMD